MALRAIASRSPECALGRRRIQFAAAAAFAAIALFAVPAAADSTAIVHVRTLGGDDAEAIVTLTPVGGGAPLSCRTARGTCRINGVRGGNYIVTADPVSGGEAPVPRRLLLPPSGEVAVHVTLL
jgi:hypothetical protein